LSRKKEEKTQRFSAIEQWNGYRQSLYLEWAWAVLKKGGIMVSLLQPPSPEKAKEHGARGQFISPLPPLLLGGGEGWGEEALFSYALELAAPVNPRNYSSV
jgi:hypothetical protein